MPKATLLLTAALVSMVSAAAGRPPVILSPDDRVVSLPPGSASAHRTTFAPGTKYLFTNFATKEPEGVYLGVGPGWTISGPSSFFGKAYGVAEQFTLRRRASATTLAAAVGYVSGDDSVTLTLYADNGSNSPGTVLASGTSTTTTLFGACCGITSVQIASTALAAGTPYWIGITTTGSNFESSNPQISDQVDEQAYESFTSDGGSSWRTGSLTSGTELPAIGIK